MVALKNKVNSGNSGEIIVNINPLPQLNFKTENTGQQDFSVVNSLNTTLSKRANSKSTKNRISKTFKNGVQFYDRGFVFFGLF